MRSILWEIDVVYCRLRVLSLSIVQQESVNSIRPSASLLSFHWNPRFRNWVVSWSESDRIFTRLVHGKLPIWEDPLLPIMGPKLNGLSWNTFDTRIIVYPGRTRCSEWVRGNWVRRVCEVLGKEQDLELLHRLPRKYGPGSHWIQHSTFSLIFYLSLSRTCSISLSLLGCLQCIQRNSQVSLWTYLTFF